MDKNASLDFEVKINFKNKSIKWIIKIKICWKGTFIKIAYKKKQHEYKSHTIKTSEHLANRFIATLQTSLQPEHLASG